MKLKDKQLSTDDASASRLVTEVFSRALMIKTALMIKFYSYSAFVKF